VYSFEENLKKIWQFTDSLLENRNEYINTTINDLGFCKYDCAREIDHNINQLRLFPRIKNLIDGKKPVGNVSVMLPYDGSAWLNVAILSAWIAGNRVVVKFSSKGSEIARLTERLYKPIFGQQIRFSYQPGKKFIQDAINDATTNAIIVFGSDQNILPYEKSIKESGKKLVFEGPGNDPFIVFDDAPIDDALDDLIQAKYGYSGQTCTAPERILIQKGVYREFIDKFIKLTEEIDHQTDPSKLKIVPIASDFVVKRLEKIIQDAKEKGGKIVYGGKIEGNTVQPTIITEANSFMLGMKDEIFGPVSMIMPFENRQEAYKIAIDNRYCLRASIWGGQDAWELLEQLKGKKYAHEVDEFIFGKFGTISYNKPRRESWRGALVTRPIGGYGYSGWIWERKAGKFITKQGPKLLSIETTI